MSCMHPWTLGLLLILTSTSLAQKPPAVPEGVTAHRDLAYVENGHERQKLDLYLPKSDKPLPLVIWVHGGAWRAGSKDRTPALPLTAKGFAVASINYRLSQHAVFPAQIEDCKAAVRWLRANAKKYNFDTEYFGVWGASAGGHLVALMGTAGSVKELEGKLGNLDQSSKVQAVCDFFGPTDFQKLGGRGGNSPLTQLIGGPLSEHKEMVGLVNPITHITKDAPPFLIVHGTKDTTVPIGQSELLNEALKKAGVDVTYVAIEGAGHGGAGFSSEKNRTLIEDFFSKHLKKQR